MSKEERKIIGICQFRCGGAVLETTPVYAGESPDSDVIYARGLRAIRILDPSRAHLLRQCERRFYPSRIVEEVQNGQ